MMNHPDYRVLPAPSGWRQVCYRPYTDMTDKQEKIGLEVNPVIGWVVETYQSLEGYEIRPLVGISADLPGVLDCFLGAVEYFQLGYLQPGEIFEESEWMSLAEQANQERHEQNEAARMGKP